jgi:hypothetical protein
MASERDGFGYAIQGIKGVFGERTLSRYWATNRPPKLPFLENSESETFGDIKQHWNGPALFHGRTSTNHKSLINTHPIQKRGWSLIHNGVVTNHGPDYKMNTTNDTEHLLEYLSTTGIKGIEDHLSGYYAIAAIDPKGRLHLARDSKAWLYSAYIPVIESHVFATTQALIEELCEELEWTHEPIYKVQDNVYIIMNGNKVQKQETIKPRGFSLVESQFANRSLSYQTTGREYLGDYQSHQDRVPFLQECAEIDSSYTITDDCGVPIELNEFHKLDDISKMNCVITRPDGTIVDPDDYYTDKLA